MSRGTHVPDTGRRARRPRDDGRSESAFPETIPLPNGFQPEGISIGKGTTFYVGSIPTGAVYRGDLRTGDGSRPRPGGGAPSGDRDRVRPWPALRRRWPDRARLSSTTPRLGRSCAEVQLAVGAGATFVNDVVVTKDAAFFTDSQRAVLYRVPLWSERRAGCDGRAVPLTGDFRRSPAFNLNGIEATADG